MKCDEARPICLNCERQDDTCDYSVRLNWDGRGKRKAEIAEEGQVNFSANVFSAGLDAHVQKKVAVEKSGHSTSNAYHAETPLPNNEESHDLSPAHSNDENVGKASSSILSTNYTTGKNERTAQTEPPQMLLSKKPVIDITVIDPCITTRDAQQQDIFRPFSSKPPSPFSAKEYSQSYERYHSAHLPTNVGPAQQPTIPRLYRSPTPNSGLESSLQSSLENSTTNIPFTEFTADGGYIVALSVDMS